MSAIQPLKALLFVIASVVSTAVFAVSLSDLSNKEAASGLKTALEIGSAAAVSKLGVHDGFLENERVRIPLPQTLEQARPLLKMVGRSQQLDELAVAMNRAAESALPLAKPLLLDAVKSMSVTDAKNILAGSETSVTDFFRSKTAAPLAAQFLPIVKSITDRSGLATKYNTAIAQMTALNLISNQHSTVEAYVVEFHLKLTHCFDRNPTHPVGV